MSEWLAAGRRLPAAETPSGVTIAELVNAFQKSSEFVDSQQQHCLAYPALDAMRAGYEVFVPVDAVGGTSLVAHDAALRRVEQAGARPVSWTGVLCELQRDWAREATTRGMVEIASAQGGPRATEIALKQFASKGMKT